MARRKRASREDAYDPPVQVEAVREVTPELVAALRRLVPQLSASASDVDTEAVARIVHSDVTQLFVGRDDDGEIVGTLTLATFAIPTGIRAWIEDVVVDERARGRGVGRSLTTAAIEAARAAGARTVELTSRAARVEANAMYQRLGFEQRETNVYRLALD